MTETEGEPPFRVTVYFSTGDSQDFPVYMDAARASIERSMRWRPPHFAPSIMEALDDRAVVMDATLEIYAELLKKPEGTLYMVADDGSRWALPARSILMLRMRDGS